MCLYTGFEKFARTHSLEVGCLLICRYEGGGDMSVDMFDDSCCRLGLGCSSLQRR
jgi:hypothetical protein